MISNERLNEQREFMLDPYFVQQSIGHVEVNRKEYVAVIDELLDSRRRLLELEEAKRSKAGKCLECQTPINPTLIGLCDRCFTNWLREIGDLPEQPAQEVKR